MFRKNTHETARMSTQISKPPNYPKNHKSQNYPKNKKNFQNKPPEISKITKLSQKSQIVQSKLSQKSQIVIFIENFILIWVFIPNHQTIPKITNCQKQTPRNLLINQNSLKNSKMTKTTRKSPKLPKYPKNHKMSKKNPDISKLPKIALKSLKWPEQSEDI